MDLCYKEDDFLIEKCYWIVKLTNGELVYQDDNRPGLSVSSAWKRLGLFLRENIDIKIESISLKYCSHIVNFPQHENEPIYFYSNGVMQSQGVPSSSSGYHIVGWLINENEVICNWFKKPELICLREIVKNIADCGEFQLIKRDNS
jgi:hypothetical protein